jgi:HemY protein
MMRFFSFIIQIAAVVAVAIWLADRPGSAHIVWHDTVIETSAAFLALCVLGIAYIIHMLFRLWHFLRHGPVHWRLRRRLAKMQKGQDQLTQGLIAIASGNAAEAGRLAVASRKNTGNGKTSSVPSLWLQAQAAQLAGDHRAAREIFRTLAADSEAAILGYRGLITEAKRGDDWTEVDRLMAELHGKKPATPWLSLIRMESAARRQQWDEAEQALSHASAARLMDSEGGRRTRAALRVASSRNAAASGDITTALHAAEQAARQAPDWLPAIINLAEVLSRSAHKRAAARVIERAWKARPHPQLAQIVRRQAQDSLDALRQIEHLCRHNLHMTESRAALAETALAADIWGEARRHLTASAAEGTATRNIYKMLARLERRQHGDERTAASWLMKATEAPADPAWLCNNCGGAHDLWQPVCGHCGAFNAVEWQIPGHKLPALPASYKPLGDLSDND